MESGFLCFKNLSDRSGVRIFNFLNISDRSGLRIFDILNFIGAERSSDFLKPWIYRSGADSDKIGFSDKIRPVRLSGTTLVCTLNRKCNTITDGPSGVKVPKSEIGIGAEISLKMNN